MFPSEFAQRETKTASSGIWTQVAKFISSGYNRYDECGTSFILVKFDSIHLFV